MDTPRIRPFAPTRFVALSLAGALLAAAAALLASVEFNTHTAIAGGGGAGCFPTSGVVCTVKGQQAFADFSSESPDACTITDVQVAPFDSVVRPAQGQGGQFVLIMITQENVCGTFSYISASNVDPVTNVPDFTGTFQANSGSMLNTASLVGSAPMFDPLDNIQFTSTINVAWTGFGPTTTFVDSFHLRSAGLVMNEHVQGSDRQAEASGVVTGPTGTNLASTPTLNADLTSSSGGTVSLSRP